MSRIPFCYSALYHESDKMPAGELVVYTRRPNPETAGWQPLKKRARMREGNRWSRSIRGNILCFHLPLPPPFPGCPLFRETGSMTFRRLRLRHGGTGGRGPPEAVGEHLVDEQDGAEHPPGHRDAGKDGGGVGGAADGTDAHVEAGDELSRDTASGEEEDKGEGFAEERGNRVRSW